MNQIQISHLDHTITLAENFKANEIDSTHILIGDNGSGKTTIIKNIAKSICEKYETPSISLLGDFSNHKIIYYTPSPYHEKIKSSNRFTDCSGVVSNINSAEMSEARRNLFDPINRSSAKITISINLRSIAKIALDLFRLNKNQQDHLPERLHSTISNLQKIQEKKESISRNPKANSAASLENIANQEKNQKHEFINHFEYLILNEVNHSPIETIANLLTLQFETSSRIDKTAYMDAIILTLNGSPITDDILLYRSAAFLHDCHLNGKPNEENPLEYSINEEFLQNTSPEVVNLLTKNHVIKYKMSLISSGEACLKNQTFAITRELSKSKYKKARIILFIDEGDMLLHVKWQQQYIKMLSEFLSRIKTTQEIAELHLICATHSPFLVSDIASKNIININSDSQIKKTFAVPIHNIIRAEFGGELIGAVAESEIERLIQEEYISDEDLEIIEDEFLKKLIKITRSTNATKHKR